MLTNSFFLRQKKLKACEILQRSIIEHDIEEIVTKKSNKKNQKKRQKEKSKLLLASSHCQFQHDMQTNVLVTIQFCFPEESQAVFTNILQHAIQLYLSHTLFQQIQTINPQQQFSLIHDTKIYQSMEFYSENHDHIFLQYLKPFCCKTN